MRAGCWPSRTAPSLQPGASRWGRHHREGSARAALSPSPGPGPHPCQTWSQRAAVLCLPRHRGKATPSSRREDRLCGEGSTGATEDTGLLSSRADGSTLGLPPGATLWGGHLPRELSPRGRRAAHCAHCCFHSATKQPDTPGTQGSRRGRASLLTAAGLSARCGPGSGPLRQRLPCAQHQDRYKGDQQPRDSCGNRWGPGQGHTGIQPSFRTDTAL